MDFNKIKEMGLEYAEKGKNAALDLAEKGRTQAKIVNAQGKLYRAQRQLGALVYSLAKGNEENQPLDLIEVHKRHLTCLCPGGQHSSAFSAQAVPVPPEIIFIIAHSPGECNESHPSFTEWCGFGNSFFAIFPVSAF